MARKANENEEIQVEVSSDWAGEQTVVTESPKVFETPMQAERMDKPVYFAICRDSISMMLMRGVDERTGKKLRAAFLYENKSDHLIDYFDEADKTHGIYLIERFRKIIHDQKVSFDRGPTLYNIPMFKELKALPPKHVMEEWSRRKIGVSNAFGRDIQTESNQAGHIGYANQRRLFYRCWGWYLWTGQDIFFDHFPKALIKNIGPR